MPNVYVLYFLSPLAQWGLDQPLERGLVSSCVLPYVEVCVDLILIAQAWSVPSSVKCGPQPCCEDWKGVWHVILFIGGRE